MLARSTQWRGSTAPDRRTLSFGKSATLVPLGSVRPRESGDPYSSGRWLWVPATGSPRGNDSERAGRDDASYAAGALARTCFGKMRVHDAPAAGFLAEHHGRAGDELIAAV